MIKRLAKDQKLVLVITSSNKSLHAFYEAPQSEAETNKFTDLAITLGADRAVLRQVKCADSLGERIHKQAKHRRFFTMQDDSTNFVKYFTDNEVLEKLGAENISLKAEERL